MTRLVEAGVLSESIGKCEEMVRSLKEVVGKSICGLGTWFPGPWQALDRELNSPLIVAVT